MKKVIIDRIMETSYEDGSHWVEYKVDGENLGYIDTKEFKEDEEKVLQELIDNGSFNIEKMINKNHVSVCSNYLAEIIENCRQSENEMWFVEDEEISKEEIEKIEEEVSQLGLDGYITFNEDGCAITVYGGVITQFLFSKPQ